MAHRPQTTGLTYMIQDKLDKAAPGFTAGCAIRQRKQWEIDITISNPAGITVMATQTIASDYRDAHKTAVQLIHDWICKAFDFGYLIVEMHPDKPYPSLLKNCATLGHRRTVHSGNLTCTTCKTRANRYEYDL